MTADHIPGAGGTRRWWQIRWLRQHGRNDYERTIDDLRSSLETARHERDKKERMAAAATACAQVAEAKLAEVQRELALARQQANAARRTAAAAQPGGPGEQPPPVATQLLFMADRLADFITAGASANPERAGVMVGWVNGMIPELLSDCGVMAFRDDGPVNFRRHETVGERPAPAPELAGHIAETIRPGYEWHGELLRTQRVVTYAAG